MSITLKELLGEISVDEFKEQFWGKQTLFIKNAINNPEELGSKEMFERELNKNGTKWNLRPQINVESTHFASSDDPMRTEVVLRNESLLNAKNLRSLGWYLTADKVEQGNRGLCEFLVSIETQLDTLSNNYIADYFQGSEGQCATKLHNDVNEVFAIQLEGSKYWYVDDYPSKLKVSYVSLPNSEEEMRIISNGMENQTVRKKEQITKLRKIKMEKGDFLYVPAFAMHQTRVSSKYSLSVSILRDHTGVLEILDKLLEYNDPDLYLKYRNCIRFPDSPDELRNMLLSNLDDIISGLSQKDDDFYKKLAWFASTAPFNKHMREFKNKNNMEHIDFDTNTIFQKDPMRRAKLVECGQKDNRTVELFIDGQPLEFDDKKWFPFAHMLANGEPFSGKEVLKLCNMDKNSGWEELKSFLTEILKLDFIQINRPQSAKFKKAG